MGKGSVTSLALGSSAPRAKPPSWRLTAPNDSKVQGLVVSGVANVPSAQALFLCGAWPDDPNRVGGGSWLKELQLVAPIPGAEKKDAEKKSDPAPSLAFTF